LTGNLRRKIKIGCTSLLCVQRKDDFIEPTKSFEWLCV
jgi:hypothetical protein